MSKVKNFFQSSTISKLKKIGKILNLKIYPKKFHNKGFRSVYSKLIFNLIFFEKKKALKNYFYKKIFNKKKFNKDVTINFLISTPSSGGTFLRMMISSYLELYYKIGNGVPKYDSIYNKWMFSYNFFESADLQNSIDFDLDLLRINSKLFRTIDDLESRKMIFSRYPLTPIELYDLDQVRPIIVMRHPYDQIVSYYSKNFKDQKDESLDIKLLNKAINNYLEYFNFWKNYFKKNSEKKDYLLIRYENLIVNSEEELRKALSFYKIEINNNLISKASLINSKETTLKSLSEVKINKIRFVDESKKNRNRDKILHELNKIDKIKDINEAYYDIK
jgi:hypothetical protein